MYGRKRHYPILNNPFVKKPKLAEDFYQDTYMATIPRPEIIGNSVVVTKEVPITDTTGLKYNGDAVVASNEGGTYTFTNDKSVVAGLMYPIDGLRYNGFYVGPIEGGKYMYSTTGQEVEGLTYPQPPPCPEPNAPPGPYDNWIVDCAQAVGNTVSIINDDGSKTMTITYSDTQKQWISDETDEVMNNTVSWNIYKSCGLPQQVPPEQQPQQQQQLEVDPYAGFTVGCGNEPGLAQLVSPGDNPNVQDIYLQYNRQDKLWYDGDKVLPDKWQWAIFRQCGPPQFPVEPDASSLYDSWDVQCGAAEGYRSHEVTLMKDGKSLLAQFNQSEKNWYAASLDGVAFAPKVLLSPFVQNKIYKSCASPEFMVGQEDFNMNDPSQIQVGQVVPEDILAQDLAEFYPCGVPPTYVGLEVFGLDAQENGDNGGFYYIDGKETPLPPQVQQKYDEWMNKLRLVVKGIDENNTDLSRQEMINVIKDKVDDKFTCMDMGTLDKWLNDKKDHETCDIWREMEKMFKGGYVKEDPSLDCATQTYIRPNYKAKNIPPPVDQSLNMKQIYGDRAAYAQTKEKFHQEYLRATGTIPYVEADMNILGHDQEWADAENAKIDQMNQEGVAEYESQYNNKPQEIKKGPGYLVYKSDGAPVLDAKGERVVAPTSCQALSFDADLPSDEQLNAPTFIAKDVLINRFVSAWLKGGRPKAFDAEKQMWLPTCRAFFNLGKKGRQSIFDEYKLSPEEEQQDIDAQTHEAQQAVQATDTFAKYDLRELPVKDERFDTQRIPRNWKEEADQFYRELKFSSDRSTPNVDDWKVNNNTGKMLDQLHILEQVMLDKTLSSTVKDKAFETWNELKTQVMTQPNFNPFWESLSKKYIDTAWTSDALVTALNLGLSVDWADLLKSSPNTIKSIGEGFKKGLSTASKTGDDLVTIAAKNIDDLLKTDVQALKTAAAEQNPNIIASHVMTPTPTTAPLLSSDTAFQNLVKKTNSAIVDIAKPLNEAGEIITRTGEPLTLAMEVANKVKTSTQAKVAEELKNIVGKLGNPQEALTYIEKMSDPLLSIYPLIKNLGANGISPERMKSFDGIINLVSAAMFSPAVKQTIADWGEGKEVGVEQVKQFLSELATTATSS